MLRPIGQKALSAGSPIPRPPSTGPSAATRDAFWLDSSRVDGRARFSFMGAATGPRAGRALLTGGGPPPRSRVRGHEERHEDIFDYLRSQLQRLHLPGGDGSFGFLRRFVGYFGYELKALCGGSRCTARPARRRLHVRRPIRGLRSPREALLPRLPGRARVASRGERLASRDRRQARQSLPASPTRASATEPPARVSPPPPPASVPRGHRPLPERLREGESYEICLTNQRSPDARSRPLRIYRALRRLNPAPFAAFLRFGGLSVLSSSPERFLTIGRERWVEAKPIKGTAARGATPRRTARPGSGCETVRRTAPRTS